ncbi:MAG TPA: DnaJ domain-containing protein, partial [Pirellulales bacterium]
MADDYYQVLGVDKNASQADIQKAYRSLARKFHPDLHPDDKTAKEKFQKVQAAFDVLNDTSKRELYDRYGSAFESAAAGGAGAGAAPRGGQSWYTQGTPGGYEEIDFGQLFGERFGEGGGAGGGGSPFADLFGGFQRAAQAGGKG